MPEVIVPCDSAGSIGQYMVRSFKINAGWATVLSSNPFVVRYTQVCTFHKLWQREGYEEFEYYDFVDGSPPAGYPVVDPDATLGVDYVSNAFHSVQWRENGVCASGLLRIAAGYFGDGNLGPYFKPMQVPCAIHDPWGISNQWTPEYNALINLSAVGSQLSRGFASFNLAAAGLSGANITAASMLLRGANYYGFVKPVVALNKTTAAFPLQDHMFQSFVEETPNSYILGYGTVNSQAADVEIPLNTNGKNYVAAGKAGTVGFMLRSRWLDGDTWGNYLWNTGRRNTLCHFDLVAAGAYRPRLKVVYT